MQSKMDSINKNGTWELCDLPKGKNAFDTKWFLSLSKSWMEMLIATKHD